MNFTRFILNILARRARAFERATTDPARFQKKVLFECLARNRNTEYGRKHGFSRIRSVEEYQEVVPVSTCESLSPYTERMAEGELNVLTAEKPVFFGLTSGTTSKPKFIPVTKCSLAGKNEVTNLWAYYTSRDHPGVLKGKILAVVNTAIKGFTGSGVPYGYETGFGYRNLPGPIRRLYAVPCQVFDITDYESRYYCILRIALECDITVVATPSPGTVVLLCRKIEQWKEKIINDIEHGTLERSLNIPEGIRKEIEKTFKPNPERAHQLRAILKEKGELLPGEIWRGLELIECWKGGMLKLYLKEIRKYFGDIPVRDFGYISTEARCSIPTSDDGAEGVLAINTNFYEFVPREDADKNDKRFLLCDQLEEGREYFVIVTTPGGLYRYDIDDIIRVTGFFERTPVIEFVQRGLNCTSLAGEKLYEAQVSEAVNEASELHGVALEFFTVSIEWGHPPRYVFLVEFDGEASPGKKRGLLRSVEEGLRAKNVMYHDKRNARLVGDPVLRILRKGEFERYRSRKAGEGANDTQFKPPVLTADPHFREGFDIEEEVT